MQSWHTESWSQFQSKVDEFEASISAERERSGLGGSSILYRGQGNENWQLDTTLERSYAALTSMSRYYRATFAAKAQIEAHTGKSWNIMGWDKYRELAKDSESRFDIDYPGYEYLAYMRHHGFPSPLLDWTRSPYVASFFALRDAAPSVNRVAVYFYCGDVGRGRMGSLGDPTIVSRGPYVSTHRRHFLQQSEYTICIAFRDGEWHYVNHETALMSSTHTLQDVTWKVTIPVSLRNEVLATLDRYNLNAYTLLQSEESLMEMVAGRELPRAIA